MTLNEIWFGITLPFRLIYIRLFKPDQWENVTDLISVLKIWTQNNPP